MKGAQRNLLQDLLPKEYVGLIDRDFNFKDLNGFFAIKFTNKIGPNSFSLVPHFFDGDFRFFEAAMNKAVQLKQPVSFHARLKTDDGSPMTIEWNLLPDPSGEHVVIRFKDATDELALADKIEESLLEFSQTSGEESIKSLLASFCDRLGFAYAFVGELQDNNKIKTRYLYGAKQWQPDLIYDVDTAPCRRVINGELCLIEKGVIQLYPQDHLLKVMKVEAYLGVPIMDEQDELSGVLVLLSHSSIVHLEAAKRLIRLTLPRVLVELKSLRLSMQSHRMGRQLEHLSRNIPGVLFTVEAGYEGLKLIQISNKVEEVFGLNPNQCLGELSSFKSVWDKREQEDVIEVFGRALRERSICDWQGIIRHAVSGDPKNIILKVQSDSEGKILEGIIIDITDKFELQQQLTSSFKLAAVGELAASVVHEINNPLMIIQNRISSLAKMVKEENINRTQVEESLGHLTKAVSRIAYLVKSLKSQSHLETQRVLFDAVDSVRSAREFYEPILKKSGIKLIVDIMTSNSQITADPIRLEQVILNLIQNARDAIETEINLEKEYFVKISVENTDSELIIRIQDNGPGISSEIKDKIFDKFYTTKEKGKGSGLGLHISSQLIAAMNGKLEFDSAWSSGAGFLITLPLT